MQFSGEKISGDFPSFGLKKVVNSVENDCDILETSERATGSHFIQRDSCKCENLALFERVKNAKI